MAQTGEAMTEAILTAYKEVETGGYDVDGIRLTLARGVTFSTDRTNPIRTLTIERERKTASGRQGKPVKLATIVNNEGETLADMLRTFVALVEQDA